MAEPSSLRATVVRGGVAAIAAWLLAGASGEASIAPPLAMAMIATLVLAAEAFLGMRALPFARPASHPRSREAVVDTSALIDGRLADVAECGFLDMNLIVPKFVLGELQHLADASDPLRRARGRRGQDVLQTLRESSRLPVHVVEDDISEEREVDLKLVALARRRGAALITTDFELNRVAGIRGVVVLNVNELAHAVRPVVLPGERLRVTVVKEGKEPGQGIAYLADGAMVVVEQGRALVGRTTDVVVTSALQTAAGKMFFAKPTADT